jgi:hypothetical protein
VNGVATSNSGLQLILDYLHTKFGRKVVGIHNRTFGIWWDLVECMLQRDFLWPTLDVREGYQVRMLSVYAQQAGNGYDKQDGTLIYRPS